MAIKLIDQTQQTSSASQAQPMSGSGVKLFSPEESKQKTEAYKQQLSDKSSMLIEPVQDTSRKGWLDSHPWMKSELERQGVIDIEKPGQGASPKDFLDYANKQVMRGVTPGFGSGPVTLQTVAREGLNIVKAPIKGAVQVAKGLVGGVADLTGNEELKAKAFRPTKVPLIGEVKGISADPMDEERYGTQTPGETLLEAVEVAASAPTLRAASKVAKDTFKKVTTKTEKSLFNEALEVVRPKTTSKTGEEALRRGKTKVSGIWPFKKTVITPEKDVVESVQGIVKNNAEPQVNINAVKAEQKRISEKEILPYLERNKTPFNQQTFNARINSVQPQKMFRGDESVERVYRNAKEMAQEIQAKYPKTKAGAWKARQEFDDIAEREFPRVFDGSQQDQAIGRAVGDIRSTWNDFIAEGVPEAEFKGKLKRLSSMYRAIDTIAESGSSKLNKTAFQQWAKENPAKFSALKKAGWAGLAVFGLSGAAALKN